MGAVRLVFDARAGAGIRGWELTNAEGGEVDGLPTGRGDPASEPGRHPNGAVRVDHLVVLTPDLGRTTSALGAAGLSLRRVREAAEP
ncbi:MAG TPA: hypothetical protein VKA89_11640, partial [Solirubrobacterales bacterium]|nr:hypothetical protein [Solirubrobacterales bacterium]